MPLDLPRDVVEDLLGEGGGDEVEAFAVLDVAHSAHPTAHLIPLTGLTPAV